MQNAAQPKQKTEVLDFGFFMPISVTDKIAVSSSVVAIKIFSSVYNKLWALFFIAK